MAVWFFPEEPSAYFDLLADEIGASQGKSLRLPSAPRTRVRLGRDYRGKQYATWEDSQLIAEMEDWLKEHS
jgi:hypothetical protein